jgi:hypothetical protein
MRKIFFVPVILVIAFAAISLTARSTLAQLAADECVTKPSSAAPQGTHWYFRVNRSDHRHCWYVGPEGARVRAAARPAEPPTLSGLTSPVPVPTERPAKAESAEIDLGKTERAGEFATRWPDIQGSYDSDAREPSSPTSSHAEKRIAADSEDDMPLIWPILSPADRAVASSPPQSAAMFEHILALLAGALTFAAMLARALFKPTAADGFGWSDFRGSRHPISNANSGAPQVASSMPDTWLHIRQAALTRASSAPISGGRQAAAERSRVALQRGARAERSGHREIRAHRDEHAILLSSPAESGLRQLALSRRELAIAHGPQFPA